MSTSRIERTGWVAAALLGVAALLSGQSYEIPPYQSPPQDLPRTVGKQPIEFNHKLHAEKNLECVDCHRGAQKKWTAGLPTLEDCMVCHQSIATNHPEVRKLTQLFNLRMKKVEWTRVYDLPEFVYFSHKKHARAGAACETCHGPVATREVLMQEKSINMISCMKCHAQHGASAECFICHDLGQ